MRRREPTDEEHALWNEHTKSDKRLKRTQTPPAPAPKEKIKIRPAPLVEAPPPSARFDKDLAQGDATRMDGRSAQRFRKGTQRADAVLDLHGMSREAGFVAFRDFVLKCYARLDRRLLIITGKGRGNQPGVLRQALGNWVNDPSVRSLILAYDKAQPRHGGEGAFYLMLKKQK